MLLTTATPTRRASPAINLLTVLTMLGMLLSFPLAVYGMSVANSFPVFKAGALGKLVWFTAK